MEQQMDERHKEKIEDAIILLTELKDLRDNGKTRSDKVVKDKEQQLQQCLQIPNEAWHGTCSDLSFDDVINKLESGLGEMTEMALRRRQLSPSELIRSASGGLALRGILLTNNIESSTEIRKMVVEAPESITLLSPISSQGEKIVEFTSRKQSDDFTRSLDIFGYDVAVSGKGGICLFQGSTSINGDASLNKHHGNESNYKVKSNGNEVFHSKEKIVYVPISICEFRKDKLMITKNAAEDLHKIELVIEGTSDEDLIRKECETFFKRYGSHVNTGIIEFGGVYRWVATYFNEVTENKHGEIQIVNDTLDGFVSLSFTVFGRSVGFSVRGNHIKSYSTIKLHIDETQLSKVMLEVTKKGGPQNVTSLPLWKDDLIKNNDKWAVVNRGTNLERDLVGIWELIPYNSDSFNNSKKLSKTLQDTWEAINGIKLIYDELQDNIFEFNEFLDEIKHWISDDDFDKKIAGYLAELHRKVQDSCHITGGSKLWVTKLRNFKPLSEFILKMLQIKDQISEPNLIHVQYHLNEILKLTNDNDFPKRADLILWMVSLNTRIDKITPSLITNYGIPRHPEDISIFILIIRESLQPAMHSALAIKRDTAEFVYMKATNDLSRLIRKLQTKLKEDRKHHDLFFVLVVLKILQYNSESMVQITDDNLEIFISEFKTFYEKYRDHQTAGDIECSAFLISELVGYLDGIVDDGIMLAEFQHIYGTIQNHLPHTIQRFVSMHTESPPYHWETIRSTFNEVKRGNLQLLDMKLVDMTDFNKTFQINRHFIQQIKQKDKDKILHLTTNSYNQQVSIEDIVERILRNNLQMYSVTLRNEIETNPIGTPLRLEILEGSISTRDISVEYHLSEVKSFSYYANSLRDIVTRKEKSERNQNIKKHAVAVINNIFRSVDIYLSGLSQVNFQFQESYARQIISKVVAGTREHNNDEKQSFTLLPTLKVKLAVHASRFAIYAFKKTQTERLNKDAMKVMDLDQNKKSKFILEHLGLIDYYPSKISMWNVMAVSDIPKDSIAALPWRIMQKLIMLDYIGRYNEIIEYSQLCKNNKTETSNVEYDFSLEGTFRDEECATLNVEHPQDIFLTILACCDLILKQTIIYKMFLCRLAVPFISPELIGESLQLSLWAFRSITIERKVDDAFKASSVIKEPIKAISFIRLGKPSCSKSVLLNHVMNDQSTNCFWNRECPLSQEERQLANGLVECQWFIPSCKRVNTFEDVTMFMNLRGDACKFKKQVNVMKYFSNIIVCIVEISDIGRSDVFDLISDLHAASIRIILVLTTRDPESMKKELLRSQLEPYNVFGKNVSFILGFHTKSMVKPIVDMKHDIRKVVNVLLEHETGKIIEDICFTLKMDGIHIDEEAELCKPAKELAQEVISCVDSNSTYECKNTMLQLQGSILKEWSDLQKKKERSGRNNKKSNVIHEMACIQEEMIVLRKKQLNYSLPLSKLMTYFLKNLAKTVGTPTGVLFLQWVKFYLDEKCTNTLPGLRSQYQAKWTELNSSGIQSQQLKLELVEVEKKLADASLGLEHLLREMSQIYEAAIGSKKQLNPETLKNIRMLPIVAAKLLTEGQPIEIMDGDTASVPITWIKDLFNGLKKLIGMKTLYVISVLGVQSSGKSTLLNTMFGLQFATTVGRCTRGAFIQLIEVKDDTMNYDYVLVVDTEGLRAPELGHTKHVHDNELATFVVGIGDVTIINIKGENMSEMSDVLQIVVHAFLRMKLVNQNFQLHRSCVFIHQNVPAADAKDKMKQSCQKLQEILDQLTEQACQIENITNIHSFNQVIDFDRNKHIWYFSDLWHGDPPMAPINQGYTENAQEVKHCLLFDIPKDLSFLTLPGMIQRIEDIWSGVLSDDFVFSFRNSLAASAYHSLGTAYNALKWKNEFETTQWTQTIAITQLEGCISCDSLKELSSQLKSELRKIVDDLKETAVNDVKHFFASHSLKDILTEWENKTLNQLRHDSYENYIIAEKDITDTAKVLEYNINQQRNQKRYEEEILQKAKEFAAKSKKGTMLVKDNQLLKMFNDVWFQWMAELSANHYDEPVNIEGMVDDVLWENIGKDSPSLRQELMNNPLKKSFDSKVLNGSIAASEIEAEHHLCVMSYIQKAKIIVKGNERIVKKALAVIGDIFENIQTNLDDLSKKSCRFHKSHASQVIKKVIEGIDEHNKDKEQSFQILPTLKVKLAVHTSRFAISVFKRMQADYDEKNSITKKLSRCKKNMLHLFMNLVKEKTNECIAADFIYGKLVASIKKVLDTRLPLEIVKDITLHFGSKYQLIIEILDDLAVGANFNSYRYFINSATDYSLQWLTNFMDRKFFVANHEGETKYIHMAKRLAHIIIEDLVESIKTASDAELSKKKEDQSTITWSKNFISCLTKIKIPESELAIVVDLNVVDYLNLQSILIGKMDDLMEEVMAMLDVKAENIKWPGDTPYSQVLNKLWGCQAKCPFCNEPCSDAHTTKNTNHRCIQHRPKGVRGIRWGADAGSQDERELVIESCNFEVQNKDVAFKCLSCQYECRASGKCTTTGNKQKVHKYIEYKTYLPTWDIAPSSCMDSSTYWNWFIATYKYQLSEHYDAKLPNIPNAWNDITIQQAKDSLRIYLPN